MHAALKRSDGLLLSPVAQGFQDLFRPARRATTVGTSSPACVVHLITLNMRLKLHNSCMRPKGATRSETPLGWHSPSTGHYTLFQRRLYRKEVVWIYWTKV